MGVFDLTGRKALVTGGARGLGAEMAQALARAGAAVMIGDVLEEQGRRTAKELSATGATAGFVPSTSPTTTAGLRRSARRWPSWAGWTS